MDDLQKLSVYMHYFINKQMLKTKDVFGTKKMLIMFKEKGIYMGRDRDLFPDVTVQEMTIDGITMTFDWFKKHYVEEWYERYKNEIKLN